MVLVLRQYRNAGAALSAGELAASGAAMDPTAPAAPMVEEDATKKFRRVKLLSLMAGFANRENRKKNISQVLSNRHNESMP